MTYSVNEYIEVVFGKRERDIRRLRRYCLQEEEVVN